MRLFAGNVQSYVKTLDLRMKWEREKQNPALREPDSRGRRQEEQVNEA